MGNKKQKVHENESGSHAPLPSVEFVFCLWLYYSTAFIAFIEKIGHPETVIFLFSLPKNRKIPHWKLYF